MTFLAILERAETAERELRAWQATGVEYLDEATLGMLQDEHDAACGALRLEVERLTGVPGSMKRLAAVLPGYEF